MRYSGVRYVAVWSVLVGLLALPIPAQAQARESHYQGRTVAEWQGDLEKRPLEVRQQAAQALAHFGPVAVPALAQALGDLDVRVRQAAAWVLGTFGPAAEVAVPELIRALRDPNNVVRADAASALAAIGPAAIPELQKDAESDPELRPLLEAAIRLLGNP